MQTHFWYDDLAAPRDESDVNPTKTDMTFGETTLVVREFDLHEEKQDCAGEDIMIRP